MKQITIISGKGGTGKTTVTGALAKLADDFVVADCDVDAADLHLLLNPQQGEKQDFYSGKGYIIDKNLCLKCGKCQQVCRFDAIDENFIIDPISCEGCGACYFACPAKAINVKDNLAGEYYVSSFKKDIKVIPFVHANLHIAEDNSGKLVAQVRKEAKRMADLTNAKYILIDGPPGIGCPVNAAISGIDLAVIVTEPTLSGIHDLKRIIEVTKHFNVSAKVVINKFDINLENTLEIEKITKETKTEIVSKIPYDKAVVESLIAGETIVEHFPGHRISYELKRVWERIK